MRGNFGAGFLLTTSITLVPDIIGITVIFELYLVDLPKDFLITSFKNNLKITIKIIGTTYCNTVYS